MSLRIRAIVPMKPLPQCKTRLASRLDPDRRALLSLAMLAHVLHVTRQVGNISEVAVIGGDRVVREACHRRGAGWMPEPGPPPDLNRSLAHAIRVSVLAGADASLFLPADLPDVAPADLARLLGLGAGGALVLAPDRFGEGTNALLAPSGVAFEPLLGPGSFQRHLQQARGLGVPIEVCRCDGLAFDLDTPADLDTLLERRGGWWREAEEAVAALALPPEVWDPHVMETPAP